MSDGADGRRLEWTAEGLPELTLQQVIYHCSKGTVVVDETELLVATIDVSLKAQDKVREMIHRHFPDGMGVRSDDLERWGAELMAFALDKRLERLAKEGRQS